MSKQSYNVVVLPGDGIGPEVVEQATRVLELISSKSDSFSINLKPFDFGGAAIDSTGKPLPDDTLEACKTADAILMGKCPSSACLFVSTAMLTVSLLASLCQHQAPSVVPSGASARCAPSRVFWRCARSSTCTPTSVRASSPPSRCSRTRRSNPRWPRVCRSSWCASSSRVSTLATARRPTWTTLRPTVRRTTPWYTQFASQGITVDHQLVDSASMVMVSNPRKLNGIVLTENMFGDILSDESSVIPGALGLLPSASLSGLPDGKSRCNGLYEPIHGSAPDIAGRGIANPVGTILSAAMLLRYSLHQPELADKVEAAVRKVLDAKDIGGHELRTADLGGKHGSKDVGDAVIAALEALL
ncbi:hypothetical protein PANT_7d00148 [Moesziomyces antarcticus T-34]|uniref:Isopropylmalate dehydrogenase-like domain-containing protein n=1 Tax=Pseudozyma antarctica (strain T-34) TaxID=1151754 RepID=M9LU40_PSEA3|nr:hypothetical protein PANT_7d00148 [Moesziomyces antarcticus T-34]